MRVTLRRSGKSGEWVTHRQRMGANGEEGERFWGHYFISDASRGGEVGAYARALKDYVKRCGELGVNPAGDAVPSPGVAVSGNLTQWDATLGKMLEISGREFAP